MAKLPVALAVIGMSFGGINFSAIQASAADLIKYEIKDNGIVKSLTGKKGDPVKGIATAISRKLGNCLACHKMPITDQLFHGTVGPSLAGVASRYNEAQLRLRIINSKKVNPATSMPGFYVLDGLHAVDKAWKGKTILTAQQVEDVLAYIMTLREDASFKQTFGLMRKAGMKSFAWRGKIYSTAVAKTASKPKAMKK